MKTLATILLSCYVHLAFAQTDVNKLKNDLLTSKEDTARLNALTGLAQFYVWRIPDSALHYSLQGLPLAKKLNLPRNQRIFYAAMGEALSGKGNFALALDMQFKSSKLAKEMNDPDGIAWSNVGIGSVYFYSQDFQKALFYYRKLKDYPAIYLKHESRFSAFIGEAYYHVGEIDSAYKYIHRSYILLSNNRIWSVPYYYMGKIYAQKEQFSNALEFIRNGINITDLTLDKIDGLNGLSEVFLKMKRYDSVIYYARQAAEIADDLAFSNKGIQSNYLLKEAFKHKGQIDSAFKYQDKMLALKDSVYSQDVIKQMQGLVFQEQLRQQEITAEQELSRNRLRIYALIGTGAVFLLIALVLWRINRSKQKAYALLEKQKHATDQQKEKAELTLKELKATQQQLIQSEKMASLGELTAGIAHEIQNPLNFINNFSDVNTELLEELQQEIDNGNIDEVKNIAVGIKQNEVKINHHGKRADAIVKGMLQHSRKSSDKKEPTDINALADEYLRLSYHGLRAKEQSFNCKLQTHFDPHVSKVDVVGQDIGRVLLNLFNNAFYAVNERKKTAGYDYEPVLQVTTVRMNDVIEIKVKDNGNGIPEKILEKIYQPFFTTKPTGEGTGLGLSLSYDIITKGHGGEMSVITKEGEGSEFIIQLSNS